MKQERGRSRRRRRVGDVDEAGVEAEIGAEAGAGVGAGAEAGAWVGSKAGAGEESGVGAGVGERVGVGDEENKEIEEACTLVEAKPRITRTREVHCRSYSH